MNNDTILQVDNLKVTFYISPEGAMPWTKSQSLKVVDGVSFDLKAGETLGIVGESGCGKSTLAEPLKTHYPKTSKSEIKTKVKGVMERVGLLPNLVNRYPHEFSGGQCQRIGIARALILKPKLIICDEPVSALDVSIQAQVVNLLMELQKEMGLSIIFIAHDLSIVKHISTRILVLYLGNMMEMANSADIYTNPRHPYTQALISAVPIPDPVIEKNKELILIEGDLPSPINPPSGCVFRTHCRLAQDICSNEKPEFKNATFDHKVACHFSS